MAEILALQPICSRFGFTNLVIDFEATLVAWGDLELDVRNGFDTQWQATDHALLTYLGKQTAGICLVLFQLRFVVWSEMLMTRSYKAYMVRIKCAVKICAWGISRDILYLPIRYVYRNQTGQWSKCYAPRHPHASLYLFLLAFLISLGNGSFRVPRPGEFVHALV